MSDSRNSPFRRLPRDRAVIKLALLAMFSAFAAFGDARTPCPALEVTQSCAADGAAVLTLRSGAGAPAALSYIIAAQVPGQAATRLDPGTSVSINLPPPRGQQITLAVVGLEPATTGTEACCLSNQRVHLPAPCAGKSPDGAEEEPPTLQPDLSVDLQISPACTRTKCSGTLTVTAPDQMPVTLTLSAKDAQSLTGADCTIFAKDKSICSVMPGAALPIDLIFAREVAAGPVRLCAQLGVAKDDASRTLALQSALARAGYVVGPVDGHFGAASMAALRRFIDDSGLPVIEGEVSPQALALLGLLPFADANPDNDLMCATAQMPAPRLVCDARTTRLSGGDCACRYKGMQRLSDAACACPKGTVMGTKGCVAREKQPEKAASAETNPDRKPAALRCDPLTTVLRNGACGCRYEGSVKINATLCLCATGLPPVPGVGCFARAPDVDADPGGRP